MLLGYSAELDVSIDRNGNIAIQCSDTNFIKEKKDQAVSVGIVAQLQLPMLKLFKI